MRQHEEGWRSVGPKFVCAECFSDYAIRDFVNENAVHPCCSYCEKEADEEIAAEMDGVLAFIARGLWREYDRPENTLPYDSREGGWQLIDPQDSHDLFSEHSWLTDGDGFNDLFDDLVSAFSDNSYVPRDPLALCESDGLKYSWETFCKTVKHHSRFVLFKTPRKRRGKYSGSIDERWEEAPVHQILADIGSLVRQHNLVGEIPRRTQIIRARQHPSAETYTTAADLGSPPFENASQSRMSPAGISMFYGANNECTAFIETHDPTATAKDAITFGYFHVARKLRLLDLTSIPDVPSIFDETKFDQRHGLIFLHLLRADMAKPIARDNRIHFEYVPTQIVSEYFRHIHRTYQGCFDGIMFQSSRGGADICYCFFATPDNCADSYRDKVASPFPFSRKDRMLVLSRSQKKTTAECQIACRPILETLF